MNVLHRTLHRTRSFAARVWAPGFRGLILTLTLLALLGIATPWPSAHWYHDVQLWQSLQVVTLGLGLMELPVLAGLLTANDSGRRELIGLQILLAWIPFAAFMLAYPYPPLWAGQRDGLYRVVPELLCLGLVFTAHVILRWLTRQYERAQLVGLNEPAVLDHDDADHAAQASR
jgi:hypothetical protein